MRAREPGSGPVARAAEIMPEPRCAYCRRHSVDPDWRPFCSERCRLADLGHWLKGDYRVAGEPPPPADPESVPDDEQ